MIIATAGHVDHGKTSLIKALTGVDTDRLEEEKRRGLSINLGYAYLPCSADIPIGFIDVPGHRRFINTMIAGISGIDLGMLVVAADDGIMPQTREHVDVLRLLGVEQLLLVISKVDRVEPARCDTVKAELEDYLGALALPLRGTYCVDSLAGTGIEALREDLIDRANQHAAHAVSGCFRLAVDRAFTIKGTGLVVTGTAQSGVISVGDTLTVSPGGQSVRVRGIRVHDSTADRALGGQRCALSLGGDVSADNVARGSWLLSADCGPSSAVLDVDVSLLGDVPFPLKHLAPVKLHIGTQRVPAKLALPAQSGEQKTLRAGQTVVAQLRLEEAVPTFRGQRFVLRDHGELVTLGGGQVLRPASVQRKFGPDVLQQLTALREPDTFTSARQMLDVTGYFDVSRFAEIANLTATERESLRQGLVDSPGTQLFEHGGVLFAATEARWQAVGSALIERVRQWHEERPRERGLKAASLRDQWDTPDEFPLVRAVLGDLLQRQQLNLKEGCLSLPAFRPARSSELDRHWEGYRKLLVASGTKIPLLSEINAQTGVSIPALRKAADQAVREKAAFRVSERRYALPDTLLDLCRAVLELAARGEDITVIALKQEWQLGRNLAVEIVEFMDGIRFTARRGDSRVVIDNELPERLFGAAN